MRLLKKNLFALIALTITLISVKSYSQTFSIAYTPNSNTYTVGTAITAWSPSVSNGTVATIAYGTPVQLSGATLNDPYGMGVDASGNIYVTNFGNNTISKYNSSGTYVGTFGSSQISNPSAITFDPSGNAYVLNYNRTNNGLGNYHGNAYVAQYSSTGTYGSTVVSGLGTATGMVADQSNNLYIAQGSYNNGNATVSQYDISTGTGLLALSLTGTTNPIGVSIDGSGNIYVLDSLGTTSAVRKYNAAGVFQSTLISGLSKSAKSIYADGSGDVYIGDTGAGTVSVYPPTGGTTPYTTITGLTDPRGMVTDTKGNLYISDFTNNTVKEYPLKGGYYIDKILPAGLSFSSTTGTFSGTPTAGSAATVYTITTYSTGGASSSTTVTITVNSTLPAFTYDPNSVDVFTTGTTITSFGPTVISGAPILSYSISGTLPAGLTFNTGTGVISGKPTATQSLTVYTITATNAVGSNTTTISIATVVADYWTGQSSTDWNDGGNWSTNAPPGPTDYASIGEQVYKGKKNEPTISSAENITVGYLALGATHQPTLTVTGSITVSNIFAVDNNATPTLTGTGKVNMPPASVVDIQGSGTLTINSGLTFTLQSNASGSASVDEITTGSIIGNVSVQRYMSAQRGYRLMASPVNAVSGVKDANGNLAFSLNYLKNNSFLVGTTGIAGGFNKTGNPTLYLYRENVPVDNSSFISGNYRGISNLTSAPTYSLNNEASNYTIPVSNGYLFYYRGSSKQMALATATTPGATATNDTLTTTGYLNQGQIIFRDWYTPSSAAPAFSNANIEVQGFNLVGNPYACTIDLDSYNSTTTSTGIYASNLSKFIYEFNPKTSNYDTYEAGSADSVYTNNGGRYIVSGQGFFVQAKATGGQLIFNETAKAPLKQKTSLGLFMSLKTSLAANVKAKPFQMLRLEMALDTVNKDDMMILFDSDAKPGYVFDEDALYRTGSGKVNLSSISDDKKNLSINKLPLSNGLNIPLKVGSNAYSKYTLNMKDIKGVPQLYDIWLKDAFTGDSVNMRTTASYTFSISADTNSYGSKRFSLMIKQNPAMAYQLLSFDAAKTGKKAVQLTWKTRNEQNYTHFTVQRSTDFGKSYQAIGGMISNGQGEYSLVDAAPQTGHNFYILKQEDINGAISYSNFADVQFQDNAGDKAAILTCYPNPAVNTINLAITPKAQGNTTYNIRISNSTGLVIKNTMITETTWQNNVSGLLTGTYLIQVTDSKDNSIVGQTKFVKL